MCQDRRKDLYIALICKQTQINVNINVNSVLVREKIEEVIKNG